jgi:DNA-binding NarL/FixJ family response regulator
VGAVRDFVDAVERVAAGGTVIDHEVVRQLLRRERAGRPLSKLTEREAEVLALMAEGRTNAAIAAALYISQAAVAKNIGAIFVKLGISDPEGNHRVLAVLTYLRG